MPLLLSVNDTSMGAKRARSLLILHESFCLGERPDRAGNSCAEPRYLQEKARSIAVNILDGNPIEESTLDRLRCRCDLALGATLSEFPRTPLPLSCRLLLRIPTLTNIIQHCTRAAFLCSTKSHPNYATFAQQLRSTSLTSCYKTRPRRDTFLVAYFAPGELLDRLTNAKHQTPISSAHPRLLCIASLGILNHLTSLNKACIMHLVFIVFNARPSVIRRRLHAKFPYLVSRPPIPIGIQQTEPTRSNAHCNGRLQYVSGHMGLLKPQTLPRQEPEKRTGLIHVCASTVPSVQTENWEF
ncbi:uncharacterized protein CLUP02_06156 [Colletotrichum lupini]|uniref:Uncharacterized protein n=1 Tax=Colletotrichum lupini TaxID=145971 RepID=A0A9Q8SQD9_9PEZI|nr:uncharacterized protein CLUP02_06156 [Colletotrichum lupini]UQC80672.1 hypothetical protein CLUP02_06156 [Colletotrichum lupini]